MIDLDAILWTLLLGVPIILWIGYWGIGILSPIFEWLRPKQPVQRVLSEWIDDKYPYGRKWVMTDEDSECSELEGFESSAVVDEEDQEDN